MLVYVILFISKQFEIITAGTELYVYWTVNPSEYTIIEQDDK